MKALWGLISSASFLILALNSGAAVTAVSGLDSVEKAKQHTNPLRIWSLTQEHGWKSTVHLGASLSKGNSNNSLITAGFTLDKKRGQNEYYAKLSYAYGADEGDVNKDELLATASWKRINSSDHYTGVRLDFRKDQLADISHRMGATLLQGTFLVKKKNMWVTPEIGIGFSSQEISGKQSESFNLYAGIHSEFKLTEKSRIYQYLSAFSPMDNPQNYWVYAELGFETIITDRVSLKLFVQDQYEANPAPGRKRYDLRYITAIEYKF